MTNVLWVIVGIGLALRLIAIHAVPPSLSWDEVAIGYNAWSILHTGADEYGTSYPLFFRSFDDYKLPGLVYLTALFEWAIGLNVYAVRLPVVFAGTSMIITGYHLARHLVGKAYGITAALFIALNPWLISFSRQGFESMVSTALAFAGLYFLLTFQKNPRRFLIASVLFSTSLYFYYSARAVIALILIGMVVVYQKKLLHYTRYILVSTALALIILLPLLSVILSDEGLARLDDVFVTSDGKYHERVDRYHAAMTSSKHPLFARYWYSPTKAIVDESIANFFRNFDPSFTFTSGLVNHGLMYIWEIVTIPIGLIVLITSRQKSARMILVWFVVFPIAAAITKDQPNPLRTLIGAPIIVLISSIGAYTLFAQARKRMPFLTLGASGGIVLISVAFFVYAYFIEAPRDRAYAFGDGHEHMVHYVQSIQDKYDTIWITGDRWRPYIHYLFHSAYDPERYQQTGNRFTIDTIRFAGEWDKKLPALSDTELSELTEGRTVFILTSSDLESQIARGTVFATRNKISGRYLDAAFWAVTLK